MKRHIFLDTHELSFDGGAYQTSYFTAGPDIAYAWKAATKGDLSVEQKPDSTKMHTMLRLNSQGHFQVQYK